MKPVEAANRVNITLEKVFPLLCPFGVILGLLFPRFLVGIRPSIPLLFSTMTLTGALKLRARELGRAVSSPLPLLFFFVMAHILMPAFVFAVNNLIFRNDPDTVSGFVLLYSVPTAITAFIWVTIFKGDLALSLAIILLDTILAPAVVPLTVRILLGTGINFDMTGMVVSLLFMVAIPTVIGVSLNELSGGRIPRLATPWLAPLSKIFMAAITAANTAAVARLIRPGDPRVWLIIAISIGFDSLGFTGSKLARLIGICNTGGKPNREKSTSLFYAMGLRNTNVAMTLGIDFFPAAAALPAVLGIVFQQITAAVMSRIMLGKAGDTGKTDMKNGESN